MRAATSTLPHGQVLVPPRPSTTRRRPGRGIGCRVERARRARGCLPEPRRVDIGGDLSPGSVVSVDVTCTVDLGDVVLAGFPGSRTVTGHGVEYVDAVRGGA